MIAEYAAVKARLEADPALTGKVYDSALVNADGTLVRGQYVILFGGGPESLSDDRVTAPQSIDSDAEYLYRARSVSVTADGARAVASKVFKQLVGFEPVIAVRKCPRVKLDGSGQVKADNNVSPPLYYQDDDYLLISRRG
jgi:hypothetical protein